MLAFAFMGVYALLRGADCGNDSTQPRWLILAALAFATVFLTRISGFVYLPAVYAGALMCHVFIEDTKQRRRWTVFWFAVLASILAR